jgi:hypothetical protein
MLFDKKQAKVKIIDRVFISSNAKQNAVVEKLRNQSNLVIINWFDESYSQVQSLIQSNNLQAEIYLAREIVAHNIQNKLVLFFEHYPLLAKETELIERLQLIEAVFYSALDEALFKHFGGDRLVSMVQQLGLSENEAIEHSMITSAIKNAQEKLSKEIIVEHFAPSQAGWFSKNIVK